MTEQRPSKERDICARLAGQSGPMEDPDLCADALREIERLRTNASVDERLDRVERELTSESVQNDARRWAFFRKHHMSTYQGRRLHLWVADTVLRSGGIDGAIDEAMAACSGPPPGDVT